MKIAIEDRSAQKAVIKRSSGNETKSYQYQPSLLHVSIYFNCQMLLFSRFLALESFND